MAFPAKDFYLRLERNCNFVANSADYILMRKNDLFVSWIKLENIEKQALRLKLATKASKNTHIQIHM